MGMHCMNQRGDAMGLFSVHSMADYDLRRGMGRLRILHLR